MGGGHLPFCNFLSCAVAGGVLERSWADRQPVSISLRISAVAHHEPSADAHTRMMCTHPHSFGLRNHA
jgi:hypothetical protein